MARKSPRLERPFVLDQAFRDPVHGFIRLSREERNVLDTSYVQRLRRIHQLGPSYFVYHGAEHSRFGHALGTLQLATRLFEAIYEKRPEALARSAEAGTRNWQLVRLVALLHDVGHPPVSHSTEALMPERKPGFRYKHEDYTEAVIRGPLAEELQQQFAGLGITADMVADLLRDESAARIGREGVLLRQLVSSELDADR